MSERLEQFSYDDAIVRKFVFVTWLWGVVGMLVGIVVGLQLAAPEQDRHGRTWSWDEHPVILASFSRLLLPLALVPGRSTFSVQRVTTHLETVAWVIERFGLASVTIRGGDRTTGTVEVDGGRIGPFGRSDLVEGPAPSF